MITSKTAVVPTTQGAPSAQQQPSSEALGAELLTYSVAETRLGRLIELSSTTETDAEITREIRFAEVNVESAKHKGDLEQDAVFTPVRLANMNIEREQGKYVAYLKQPQRAAFFRCVENPALSTELLAMDFTTRFRYEGWDIPLYCHVDRFQTHGYAVIEVQYDPSKPGKFYNDGVPIEDMLMAADVRVDNYQAQEMIGRRFHKTKTQLLTMVRTHGFNPDEVDKVVAEEHDSEDKTLYCVEKIFFRVGGVVHVAWSAHGTAQDWLRAPRPFHNGVIDPLNGGQPLYENAYPFVLFPYKINEDQRVANLKGRVFFDEHQQEAATSLQSSFCTQARRASAPYWTRDGDMPDSGDDMQNVKIKPNIILNSKLKAFQLQSPDPGMLTGVQALTTQSSQEGGNINYAANNRVDSRKTATEISSAQAENALLATTQTAVFSSAMAILLRMDWEIFRSQALAGLVKVPLPREFYALNYVITPAGDIEVVARQEKLNNMKQTWPVIQNTAAAPEFLRRMLSLMFPEDAPIYNATLADDEKKTKMLTDLWNIITALVVNPTDGQLEPGVAPFLPQLQAIGDQLEAITGVPNPLKGLQAPQEDSAQFDSGYKPEVPDR